MKVICVVDSVNDINKKINILKTHFGDDILFIVKASLMPIFKTYPYQANAIYDKNLARIIHLTLIKNDPSDLVIYYTSLTINNSLITEFTKKIGMKIRIVNFIPKYNTFEKICLSVYNGYVKALFKNKDSLASPKLQFLPEGFVSGLLNSHIGNKLFEIPEEYVKTFTVEDKTINKEAKVKTKFGKSEIISLLVAMVITFVLILTYALTKPNFLFAILFVFAYLLDLVVYIMLKCKSYFDSRFLK